MMSKVPRVAVVVVAMLGCGGKTIEGGPSASSAPATEGSCVLEAGVWGCSSSSADASSDASTDGSGYASSVPARVLPPCGAGVEAGASCVATETSVDTANPNEPVHILMSECLGCGSNGLGTDWACVSQTWQALGSFACMP